MLFLFLKYGGFGCVDLVLSLVIAVGRPVVFYGLDDVDFVPPEKGMETIRGKAETSLQGRCHDGPARSERRIE